MKTPDKKKEQQKKEALTPIIDGDARPDVNLEPKVKKGDHPIPIPKDGDEGKFTTNRVDTNSLEDFRDAKE